MAIFLGTFGWHFAVGIVRLGGFWTFNPLSAVGCFVFYVLDSIIAIAMFQASARLVGYYKFPFIIMECFNLEYEEMYKGGKFEISDETCLISWWELRQFYMFILIHHFASDCHEYITCALVGTMITITIMLTLSDCKGVQCITNLDIEQVFLVCTLCIIGFALALTNDAVLYVKSQKKHLSMINLVKLVAMEGGINSMDDDYLDVIKNDIEQRVYLMNVLGVSINENFLLGLRAGVFAFLVALLAEMLI